MSLYIVFTGVLVFLARVVDVSLGTLRTISIVNGRSRIAFLLGLVEVSIWLVVISTVVERIQEAPVLGLFYAVGFAMGNVIELFIVSSRREQRNIVAMLEEMDPDVFCVSEQANVLSGYRTPLQQRGSGWRSVGKKK